MISILVTGCSGRMGNAVQEAVKLNPDTTIGGTHDIGQDLSTAVSSSEVIIDFSNHVLTVNLLNEAVVQQKPIVIGTTGHTVEEREAIVAASQKIPIVYASNFSVGVNTLFWLVRHAASILKEGYDMEIVEMHHRHKIDSPSGSARSLAEILCSVTGLDYDQDVTHGRLGNIGERPTRQIGMHSLRGGDVVGDHTVIFAGEGERVELAHKASSRMTFAQGAVRAAVWLHSQPIGLYDMEDVLGLKAL